MFMFENKIFDYIYVSNMIEECNCITTIRDSMEKGYLGAAVRFPTSSKKLKNSKNHF